MQSPVSSARRIAAANIAIAGLVVGLKLWAWRETGSVALYSDALESLVNVATALATALALHLAARPPDRHHQFGHHKAEYLAAVVEGVLIVLAAIAIIRAAVLALQARPAFELTALGIGLNGLAAAINGAWAACLVRFGRRHRSPALVADGRHLFADVVTSLGVLSGLGLVAATDWRSLDALLAMAVAGYILWAGGRLIRESMSGLMDEAVTADVAREIRAVIGQNADGAIEAHDIRTRIAGRVTFVEFHLVVPARMSVAAAHSICDRLEAALIAAMPDTEVIIHVEPEGEAVKTGAVVI